MATKCCSLINTTEEEALLLQNNRQKPLKNHFKKQESYARTPKQTTFKSSSYAARAFEVLHSLRKDEVFCDIKLETDDGTIVYGHKVILASATPYFHSMFTNFEESKKDHVILREIDSTALKLIVDFIYTAQIMVTEDNVQALLYAANLLQLEDVKEACCDFLKAHLNPTNCLGFKAFVSFYGCVELLSSFDSYIQKNFLEVAEGDEFLSLPFEEVVKLISCNELNVPSEEKVFECVISWMNHNSEDREEVLLKLMEHVRLPLTSKEYLLNKVKQEPLLQNSLKCKDFIKEALEFHLLKNEQSEIIQIFPNTIRTQPRQHKVIAVVGYKNYKDQYFCVEWYDLFTKEWRMGPKINTDLINLETTIILNDRTLFLFDSSSQRKIDVYKLDSFSSSSCLKKTASMSIFREQCGLCVIDNCIYAVGGSTRQFMALKDGEVFNLITQKWQKISEMTTARYAFGVGVLNKHLYAVGGLTYGLKCLCSVERYCPTSNTWTPVSAISSPRSNVGVGVLNGIMYAVGGVDEKYKKFRCVEVYNPRSNNWTSVSSMHQFRCDSIVFSFDGLLYVVGGDENDSVEFYNPKTDNWSMLSDRMNFINKIFGAGVIDKTFSFK